MGFIKGIKNIFSSEIKTRKEIDLEALGDYLDNFLKDSYEKAESEISEIKKKMFEEKLSLEKNIRIMENAQLKNTEIPERVKQIMEGNRWTYIQRINALIEKTNIPDDLSRILEFTRDFDKTMSDFDKAIAKNHSVMAEFFTKEASSVSNNVRNIDKFVKEIDKTLDKSRIVLINELKKKSEHIGEQLKLKSELETEARVKEAELRKLEEAIKKVAFEIAKQKESEGHKTLLTLRDYKQTLEIEITNLNSSILHSFSEIETALKKYSNQNKNDKLVEFYLEEPNKAILEDEELEIIDILGKVKIGIASGYLELKDKKKDKILSELGKLTKEYFELHIDKVKEKHEELEEVNMQIEQSEIVKHIRELKLELENMEMKHLEDKQTLSRTEKHAEEINVRRLKDSLENELTNTFGEQFKIV